MMLDQKGLAAFLAILQQGSFDKAAQQLCLTPSAISQRLKLLEENLGQSLIIRTPPLRPTQAGTALLKYGQQLHQLDYLLQQALTPKQTQAWFPLAIAVNADTLATWLLDCLAPWCLQHKIILQVRVDDQEQTHHLLQQGEVLACISARATVNQGCRCLPLGKVRYHCVASPSFQAQYFPNGVLSEDWQAAPMIRFNHKDDLQHTYLRTYFDIEGDTLAQHIMPSAESFVRWIELGMGFGLAPEIQIAPLLATGKLVKLTPDYPLDIPLYWHQWGLETELTRSLTQTIQASAQVAHQLKQ
jgi:LysR family transcriptional regulator (chromosome initiation inhibitor)